MTCMKNRQLSCSVIDEAIEVNFMSAADFTSEKYCYRWKHGERAFSGSRNSEDEGVGIGKELRVFQELECYVDIDRKP